MTVARVQQLADAVSAELLRTWHTALDERSGRARRYLAVWLDTGDGDLCRVCRHLRWLRRQ